MKRKRRTKKELAEVWDLYIVANTHGDLMEIAELYDFPSEEAVFTAMWKMPVGYPPDYMRFDTITERQGSNDHVKVGKYAATTLLHAYHFFALLNNKHVGFDKLPEYIAKLRTKDMRRPTKEVWCEAVGWSVRRLLEWERSFKACSGRINYINPVSFQSLFL